MDKPPIRLNPGITSLPMPQSPDSRDLEAGNIQRTAVNEALLISGLREHELREKAETLAEELHHEMDLRRNSDQLVRASEIRFRRLFETAESGILILESASMEITDANPFFCNLVGYSREELVGKELWKVCLFKWEAAVRSAFLELKQTGYFRDEDLQIQTKLGQTIQVGLVGNVYEESGAEVIQCNIRDVTESKLLLNVARSASLAAERANSAKDVFLAALSHELRTPLNPVLLLASEGASNPDLSAEVRHDFAAIEKNVLLEAHLIDELLDFTKISRGKVALNIEAVYLNDVLTDAIANVQSEVDAKHLNLSLDIPPGYPIANGDAMRLQQVFWNVLKNSIKFTPNGGGIAVKTVIDSSANKCVMEFSDTGIGMDPSELIHIFDPFKQIDHGGNAGSNKYGGLGLGLAIARNILGLHAGTIQAASKGIGKGSVFTIELPLGLPGAVKRPNLYGREESPVIAQKNRIRILFVEDDLESRKALVRILESRKFEVVSADTLSAALSLGSQQSFDLLITDIGLPDGNGLDLLEACARRSPHIKGIAISGYGMEADLNLSKSAKFAVHLVKPIGIAPLERALQTAKASKAPFESALRDDLKPEAKG